MALVSSQWVAVGGRNLCHHHAGAVKELSGCAESKEAPGGSVWGSSCRSRAGSVSASAVALGGFEGCARAWLWKQVEVGKPYGGSQFQGRMGVRARTVETAALDGKDLQCSGEEGLFDKFLDHAVWAVGQRDDISPLPCQVQFYSNLS